MFDDNTAPQNNIEQLFQNVLKSLEEANDVMKKAKDKAKLAKSKRGKVVSGMSNTVKFMLAPATQAAELLDAVGAIYPPCSIVGKVLGAIVKLESDRRDNDARISSLFPEFASTIAVLATLKSGFQHSQGLMDNLEQVTQDICDTFHNFAQFSETYYKSKGAKIVILHLIHMSSYQDKLNGFQEDMAKHREAINNLISRQTMLLSAANRTNILKIQQNTEAIVRVFIGITETQEDAALQMIRDEGGEDSVQSDDDLLNNFASRFGVALTPSLLQGMRESFDEALSNSEAVFTLKFEFALDQIGSQVEETREKIMHELSNGPYEKITDEEVKEVWKLSKAKEATIKRRQLIDGLNYHFSIKFKEYRVNHSHLERPDAWTLQFLNRVSYHSALGDAIDNDASGYVSITEMNDFLRKKPAKWTVPQWLAYWAYGWDADNIAYETTVNKALTQLKKVKDSNEANAEHAKDYLEKLEKKITAAANSCYNMDELNDGDSIKLDALRKEWSSTLESNIKKRLKTINYRIDYDTLAAVAGSERVEETFMALMSLLIARHVTLFAKGRIDESSTAEAITCMETVFEVYQDRIIELKDIWRRQRMDLDDQFQYYANGLLEDYYKAFVKDQKEDSDSEQSSWDSDDNYESEEETPAPRRSAAEVVTARSAPVQQSSPQGTPNEQPNGTSNRGQTEYQDNVEASGMQSEKNFNETDGENGNTYQENGGDYRSEQNENEERKTSNENSDDYNNSIKDDDDNYSSNVNANGGEKYNNYSNNSGADDDDNYNNNGNDDENYISNALNNEDGNEDEDDNEDEDEGDDDE